MRLPLAALAAVLAFCVLAAGPAPARAAGEVLLGMNYPLTGPYSVEGLDQIRAARLAVDQINAAGGILGRRAVLVPRDSASDVLQTRLNVRELLDMGCRMIFGGASSDVALEASRLCRLARVPFFATLAYASPLTVEHGHRLVFRESNDAWMTARVLGPWLTEHFPDKRYFYITADYSWGWSAEEALRRNTGTEDMEAHPGLRTAMGSTDFVRELELARDAQPGVLVLILFGKDLAYALEQAVEMGFPRFCQIVVPNLTLGMAERAGAAAMQGVVGTTSWTWKVPELLGQRRGQAFVDEFVRRYRRYPSSSGASAYTVVYQFKLAAEIAGSLEAEAIVKALEGRSFTLLKDEQTWRALDHQCMQTVFLVRGNPPEKVLSDPLRLDYFEILDSQPGSQTILPEASWKAARARAGMPPFLEPADGVRP
jgi:ABC-type branched-subunit amino acid transport system substrate-binding protein